MRVAIMGSGGVGAYVGSRLQAAGEDVVFIARGAHLAALQKDGLRLESPVHPLHLPTVNAVQEPSMVGPVDLILFAVKLGDTEAAARSLAPMIGPETRILTLQNGIDSVDLITPHVAGAKVRGGVIYVSAVIDRPGVIRSPGGLHMIVADAAHGDLVMADFFAACDRAEGLDAKPSNAIDVTLWEKFIALTSLSGTTSLLRASMGQILGHPETRILQRQLVDEAVAVGRAAGQVTRTDLADEIMATDRHFNHMRPSIAPQNSLRTTGISSQSHSGALVGSAAAKKSVVQENDFHRAGCARHRDTPQSACLTTLACHQLIR
jgi:2-dehydropantoate 2-reductase